jgi:L-glyceraldehyde 3-phosphate reductase
MPEDSRGSVYKNKLHWGDKVSEERIGKVTKLNKIAEKRGQSMAQMAVAWVLRQPAVTSALVGASKPGQIENTVKSLDNLDFSTEELERIDSILAG